MPQRRSRIASSATQSELATALAILRTQLETPVEFSPGALAEASAARPPLADIDLRDVPFVTLDPVGSRDLDQAFHLSRTGPGFTVQYAIADVPGFVRAGGELDAEARRRGQTIYAADDTIPLHPRTLSEDRASLLPDTDRPALVWTFRLDSDAVVKDVRLERARIRSRAQLDYDSVQAALDRRDDSPAALLPLIGRLRREQEEDRGGASLNLPDESVIRRPDGSYGIVRRHPLPIEDWNAQISLMTGMAAAQLMLDARVGILRTMPQPNDEAFATFRRQTVALGRPWREGDYGSFLRSLSHDDPRTMPVLQAAASLFRGAGYVAFDGSMPDDTIQAAIAAPYAHTTAPLRRLVDRWSLAICLELSAGRDAPEWARESLDELPALMQVSGQRASQLNSATLNMVEAALLAPFVGRSFEASVIELRNGGERATIQLADPAVTASTPVPQGTKAGDSVSLRLVRADVADGVLEFAI